MAALSSAASKSLLSFFLSACILMATAESSGLEFHVGGSRGWIVPPAGDGAETYNQWAMRNRFHVGDSVYFKYQNDSVLVVDREAYGQCNTSDPLLAFSDGSTRITFDRFGFFYFISGVPGHCQEGQRLIIRVMVHPEKAAAPSQGPAPGVQPGGGRGGGNGGRNNPGPPSGPNASGASSAGTGIFAFIAGLGSLMLFAY